MARTYPDLHDHIEALRKAGLLTVVDRPMQQAQRAVRGEYWETGTWCAEHRRSDVPMNTEMRTLDKP